MYYNPSVSPMASHLPLHRGGLHEKKRPPCGEMYSISGSMSAEHHIKSPPCAKEGVDGVDGRIVYYNPSATAALCHLPLHRGG